jgi:preprotein translocase subunit SecE
VIADADASSYGSASRKRKNFVSHKLETIGIWVVVVGVAFGMAWYKGYLAQLSEYVRQTREELRKCTWPTWDELKGSTLVVSIAIVLLGVFTFAVDEIFAHIVRLI